MIKHAGFGHEAGTTHHLIHGDARSLKFIPDASIHLVLTSPPSLHLKCADPNDHGLLLTDDYGAFLSGLETVWREVYRVLVPGGRLISIVGDIWLSRKKHGRHRVIPLHADICAACRHTGFDYLNPIIWHKIRENDGIRHRGSQFFGTPYEPNGAIRNDVAFILMQRKPGGYRKPSKRQKLQSKINKFDYQKWFRQFWRVPAATGSRYRSTIPFEIAHRLIHMFSFWGDTVLDPFCATGTTLVAAMRGHRNSIGIDIDPDQSRIALNRLHEEDEPLFSKTDILFMKAADMKGELELPGEPDDCR